MDQTLDEKFSGTWSTMDMQDLQKFTERLAELIVKECCQFGNSHNGEAGLWARYFIREIKEHFGVED
jgi:hypothetical protein